MIYRKYSHTKVLIAPLAALVLALAGCGTTTVTIIQGGSTPATTATPAATATPQSPCVALIPGAAPFSGLGSVPGMQMPTGTYISAAATSGGGSGQYSIKTYQLCFQGSESAIDGNSSTISGLAQVGWKRNNLFPDPGNASYLDYCSNAHQCLNTSGSSKPFSFVGFDQFASHSGGYTTFSLQVATIAAPSCLNDPQYYSGTPKYTLYEDGNNVSSSNPTYHFQMPPGTRVSTFQGGGTAGSTYVYFCSAGTQATVVNFLVQAMSNVGWVISSAASAGFTATYGSGPTYQIVVETQTPNNYYLRVFVPM